MSSTHSGTPPQARDLFRAAFTPGLPVDSEIVPGAGHCLDHHRIGAALHLRQLAFARDCTTRVPTPTA
ncbi:hypothetical protein GCM10010472_05310 [Pseudonocardia halophobica]|uniref:Alpha/beta hydrolase family protein n=1 Tax=Pseudonocardia halophobica TaxID=29401 RepID=A0A9W6NZR6_9PSEU|nr:hypothetical protein [Pseudonocardia halophobica]GLL15184.1 hypothetical protein GCM10017577_63330 [Pseudonocardia halophobica]